MDVIGKYGTAIIYNDDVEQEAISQVYALMNDPMVEGSKVRIMPDIHAGAGCVIGYTATLTEKVVPQLVGVDIGCGVTAWKLGKRSVVGEKFDKLDRVIRTHIPAGMNVRENVDYDLLNKIYKTMDIKSLIFSEFTFEVNRICKDTHQDEGRVWAAIGSLGSGNHFLELDKDDDDNFWLIIHSGSRNFGLKIALHHQKIAEDQTLTMSKDDYDAKVEEIRKTKKGKGIEVAIQKLRKQSKVQKHKRTGFEYLEGAKADAYYKDMNIAQIYAQLSRRVMGYEILKRHYKMKYFLPVESVHNYINFEDGVLRKGAISAHKGEEVIIPLNMADGCIIGTGKGNDAYNQSAPHGLGRLMSRRKAKDNIRLEDFQHKIKKAGVWSSCIGKSTLDEAPQAYKKPENVFKYMEATIDIKLRLHSVYNFKSE